MTSWISAAGRTIGILICSAMLLVSATLGQSGRVSPPASFRLEAVEAANSQPVETSQANTDTSAEPTSGTPVPEAVPQNPGTAAPQQQPPLQPTASEPSSAPPPQPVPQAGTSIVPPERGPQFNRATPVRMAPVRIQIPKAWVDAEIQTVGVTPDGEMGTPDDFWDVGWYRYGARPGDAGKSVMAGHLDSQDGAAVFYFLGDLQPGDDIRILLGGPDGERFYKVREVVTYQVDDAPLDKIFGPSDTSELVLITCGGEWRGTDAGGYDQRIVVYADMVVAGE